VSEREELLECSWQVLVGLKGFSDFIVIGGVSYQNLAELYFIITKESEKTFDVKRSPKLCSLYEESVASHPTGSHDDQLWSLALSCYAATVGREAPSRLVGAY